MEQARGARRAALGGSWPGARASRSLGGPTRCDGGASRWWCTPTIRTSSRRSVSSCCPISLADSASLSRYQMRWHAAARSMSSRMLCGSAAFAELLAEIHEHKTVTLLFGARDEQHNDAVALATFIKERGEG